MTDMVLVPREPTEAMIKAGRAAAQSADAHRVPWNEVAAGVWTAMLSAAPPASVGWQPIETAPRDGTNILAFDDGAITVLYWDDGLDAWIHPYKGGKTRWPHITHWAPLPTTPEGEG